MLSFVNTWLQKKVNQRDRTQPCRRRPPVRLRLEALEERWCLATDFWVPHNASNLDWSNGANWSLGAAPGPSDTAVFDSTRSYLACWIDEDPNDGNGTPSIQIQNRYSGQFMIMPSVVFEVNDFTDVNAGNDSFNVLFKSPTAELIFEGSSVVYNFNSSATTTPGTTYVADNSVLTLGSLNNLNINIIGPIVVNGTLDLGDSQGLGMSTTLINNNQNLTVNNGGTVNIYAGTQESTPLTNSGRTGYINVNSGGTLNLEDDNDPGGSGQIIGMGIYTVGNVNVISGRWDITNTDNKGYSVEIEGGTFTMGVEGGSGLSSPYLSYSATIKMAQAVGNSTFIVNQSSTVVPDNTAVGFAAFQTGTLIIRGDSKFTTGEIFFGGTGNFEIEMSIDPTDSDSGRIVSFDNNSQITIIQNNTVSLDVSTIGDFPVNGGLTWTLIDASKASLVGSFFSVTLPTGVTRIQNPPANTWQCASPV